jgi:hypothetical protein
MDFIKEDEGDAVSADKDKEFNDMIEGNISVWCSRYKNAKAMQVYIMVEKMEPQSQERFVATLARAAALKDTLEALTSEWGKI